MGQEYILQLYDTDLLTFFLSDHGIAGLKAETYEINQAEHSCSPLNIDLSNAGLLKWLQRRVISKNRTYVAEILKTFGLNVNDTKRIIDVCKGLSLVAYTGISQRDVAFTTSPKLTTNGMRPRIGGLSIRTVLICTKVLGMLQN